MAYSNGILQGILLGGILRLVWNMMTSVQIVQDTFLLFYFYCAFIFFQSPYLFDISAGHTFCLFTRFVCLRLRFFSSSFFLSFFLSPPLAHFPGHFLCTPYFPPPPYFLCTPDSIGVLTTSCRGHVWCRNENEKFVRLKAKDVIEKVEIYDFCSWNLKYSEIQL